MVRGKFTVTAHKQSSWSPSAREITLSAEYDSTIEEDRKYAQATPTGNIVMYVDNPSAIGQLELGKKFYVDFTEVV